MTTNGLFSIPTLGGARSRSKAPGRLVDLTPHPSRVFAATEIIYQYSGVGV